MPSFSSILGGLGVVFMLHAAYSCLHYRSILQDLDLEENFTIPPVDVYAEVALSFTMLLVGQLLGAGSFQSVEIFDTGVGRRPLVAPVYRSRDFDIYANRSLGLRSKKTE
jgi:hypothetical protein